MLHVGKDTTVPYLDDAKKKVRSHPTSREGLLGCGRYIEIPVRQTAMSPGKDLLNVEARLRGFQHFIRDHFRTHL